MPLLPETRFRNAWYMRGGHVETIVPSVWRQVPLEYTRERINTPDDDFLDLDWLRTGNRRLAVITHGLEGSSDRHYVTGTALALQKQGWDVLAWNCRSCSGEMNRAQRMYHHGETEDIRQVINHALATQPYETVALVGYSMGGSISLRYLADNVGALPSAVKAAVAVSTPLDLYNSVEQLERPGRKFYKRRFLNKLKRKMALKAEQYPDLIDVNQLPEVNTFVDFDTHFTARLHGFEDAMDFYAKASVLPHLPQIDRPILVLSAWNDPMLGEPCYPRELARQSEFVHLEVVDCGGHCGFWRPGTLHAYPELRAAEWLEEVV